MDLAGDSRCDSSSSHEIVALFKGVDNAPQMTIIVVDGTSHYYCASTKYMALQVIRQRWMMWAVDCLKKLKASAPPAALTYKQFYGKTFVGPDSQQ